MIPKETVDKILETARIEEVVEDFVSLKKRGTSLIGLCPFHNEKTPSFHVSVNKGIYKCFGCGKGGNSAQFIMEHEKYTYPEALKYLASKYNIEIEETIPSQEQQEADNRRESLYVVSARAARFFKDTLWDTEEGRSIGLEYFRERGFRDDIIKKFELGYSPEAWDVFTRKALAEGFNQEALEATGLSIKSDNGKVYDRFRARALFPIHGFTGRVIGFGGRTLKTDKKTPKYLNSPESAIYHKSSVLYGLFFARKAIRDLDNCYLVEGYADVLSLQQGGIENVVASSGTSFTAEQVRLIGRFTKNITILYDGDEAGVKASLRGLDMILEEGLNVKVVQFPEGHDPDSYIRKTGSADFKLYLEKTQKDFILFKTSVLLSTAANDPIRKAEVIRDVVESIAKIPDSIKASIFIRECSSMMQIEERILISELNKLRLKGTKRSPVSQPAESPPPKAQEELAGQLAEAVKDTDEPQEREVVRLLLLYGNKLATWEETNVYIAPYMIANLSDVTFEEASCSLIIEEYRKAIENGKLPVEEDFTRSTVSSISQLAISLLTSPYELSDNWYAKRKIYVKSEAENLKHTILEGLFHLKKKKVDRLLLSIMEKLQHETDEANQELIMQKYLAAKEMEKWISKYLGSVIVK